VAMRWIRRKTLSQGNARLLIWAVVIGIISGGTAVLFRYLALILPLKIWPGHIDLVQAVSHAPAWQRILIPVAGSALAGLVLVLGRRWSVPGHGWDILEAVVLRDGVLHTRPALVRSFSSLLTIMSAGPIGREGPMVLLSATVSSLTGRKFRVPTRLLRILVGCGVASGIACAYNTPIGAALFTMEIIVGNFAIEVFAPLVFASVVATLISRAVFGSQPLFILPALSMGSVWEFIPYTLLGILGGIVAAIFLNSLKFAASMFRQSRLPRPIAMAVTGLALGIVILWFPDVVGNGREAISHLFAQNWPAAFGLLLLVLRLLLTSATVGSGAVGGVFTPTLFIGAVLGDSFATLLHQVAPGLAMVPKAYAVVGMGALMAGTTHAPLTAAVMIFEMTLEYNIVLPVLVATAAASLVAREISRESVYTEALRRKRGAMSREEASIRALSVRDVMRTDQVTIPSSMAIPQVLDRFIAARRNHIYVLDPDGSFSGVLGLHDVNQALREQGDPSRLTAGDLANSQFELTVPEDHLDEVLERFWAEETERLPVLDNEKSRKLIGTVSQRDILGIYSLEVLHRRSLVTKFQTEGSRDLAPTYVELPADHFVEEMPVLPELYGISVGASHFRERFGISVLLIRRNGPIGKETRIIPEAETVFHQGDRITVFGSREKIVALRSMLPSSHRDGELS
jgi:chloride channel protein, CIC family